MQIERTPEGTRGVSVSLEFGEGEKRAPSCPEQDLSGGQAPTDEKELFGSG